MVLTLNTTANNSDVDKPINVTASAVEVSYKYDETTKSFIVVGSRWRNPPKFVN